MRDQVSGSPEGLLLGNYTASLPPTHDDPNNAEVRLRNWFEGHYQETEGIGNHFALLEVQFVQCVTFDLVLGQTVEPEPLITLRPRGGIQVVWRR